MEVKHNTASRRKTVDMQSLCSWHIAVHLETLRTNDNLNTMQMQMGNKCGTMLKKKWVK